MIAVSWSGGCRWATHSGQSLLWTSHATAAISGRVSIRKWSRDGSGFSEQGVDDPAAADVRPWTAQVREDVGIVAAGVIEGIGQDGKAVRFEGAGGQDALFVGGLRQRHQFDGSPSGIEGRGPEGV